MRFRCATCSEEHDVSDGIAFAGLRYPDPWNVIDDSERARSRLLEEQCIIESREGTSRYVRARVLIPIRDVTPHAHLTWGVWCSLSERSYEEMSAHWDDPARTKLGPYFGWLSTRIPGYPSTMFLKTHVHPREVGVRPIVVIERNDHPLCIDQRDGLDLERLRLLVEPLLHPSS